MELQAEFQWPILHGPWRHISKSFKLSFLSACVIGIITHIYIFTNLILNHDSVWRLYYDNNNLAIGRWALQFFSEASTRFQLPVVAAVIAILMLSLSAALTVRVLDISNKACIVLVSGFIVTFPTVACIFSYMFTMDVYFIALLLNVLAVFCTKQYKLGWIAGICFGAVACGIYQAFICYAIGLFLIDCIVRLLSEEALDNVIKDGLKYILVSLASLISYYIVLKMMLLVKNVKLSSYQGMESISIFNFKAFLMQLPLAYQKFINYFFKSPYLSSFFQCVQYFFLFMTLGALIYLALVSKVYKIPARAALVILGILMIPIALNFITILSVGADVHALMVYAFVLQFIFGIKVMECALKRLIAVDSSNWPILYLLNIFLSGLLIWNHFCISNIVYLRLQVCYENTFALANRITARIEMVEGYAPDIPVAIVGEASRSLYGKTISAFSKYNSLTGTGDVLLFSPEPHHRTRIFLEHYIGVHMPRPSKEQFDMLDHAKEIKAMPAYPENGSVMVYNGVIVLKLSDGEIR